MEKHDSFIKFYINNKCLYAKVLWKPNESDLFNIVIYDGEAAWTGRFSYAFAEKYREHIVETEEEYYNNVKKALCKEQGFSYRFALQDDDNDTATFSWKKKATNSVIILIHGSVPLHRKTEESKEHIIEFLLAENHDLLCAVDAANARNVKLLADLDKCKFDFDKFVSIKSTLETSIFDKFLQLINAKQKRIQLLDNNLFEVPNEDKVEDDKEEVD